MVIGAVRFLKVLLGATVLLWVGIAWGEDPAGVESASHAADRARWQRTHSFGDLDQIEIYQLLERARAAKMILPKGLGPSAATSSSNQSVPGDFWAEVGPDPIRNPKGNITGRIRGIALLSSNTIYAATAAGGVWKTDDGGSTWTPLTDEAPSLRHGDIAIDPQDSTVVYAGTGEYGARHGFASGAGLLRSRDGGKTWPDRFGASNRIFGGRHIARVLLHPRAVVVPLSERVIYVAASTGFWRSEDAGQSWSHLLHGSFSDAAFDALDPTIVYAAKNSGGVYRYVEGAAPPIDPVPDTTGALPTRHYGRINLHAGLDGSSNTPYLLAIYHDTSAANDLKGIWRSDNEGTTWTRLAGPPPGFAEGVYDTATTNETETASQSGLNDTLATAEVVALRDVVGAAIATGDTDLFRLNLARTSSLTVEVLAQRAGSALKPTLEILDDQGKRIGAGRRSLPAKDSADHHLSVVNLDAGNYYIRVSGKNSTTGSYQLSLSGIPQNCQCDYDMAIAAEPNDPQVIYVGLVGLERSLDGGLHWEDITYRDPATSVHTDIQRIVVDPNQPSSVYVANDGGLYRSPDRGETWFSLAGDLAITQIARFCLHPSRDDFLIVGSLDNGSTRYDAGHWLQVAGADGGGCAIESNNTWYVTEQYSAVRKTTDNIATKLEDATSGLSRNPAPFVPPLVIDPTDVKTLIASGGERDAANKAFLYVYKTADRAKSWQKASQALGDSAEALAISESDHTVYYAGMRGGGIWRTSDGGITDWTDVTTALLPAEPVSDIEILPTDANHVTISYFGTGGGRVFRTTTGGAPWTDISGPADPTKRLPDAPVHAVAVDPTYPDTIFAASEVGLFRTTNGGNTWETFDFGLPNVAVQDLILDPNVGTGGVFYAATFGRGLWRLEVGNDACENAAAIGDQTVHGSTSGASADGSASCGSSSSPDVWYRYTASCDGEVQADTCGSSFDTVVSMHAPTCPATAATESACNDDCSEPGCGGRASCASVSSLLNGEHLVRVSGYSGASGVFDLQMDCIVPNDSCDAAEALSLPADVTAGTRGATWDNADTCNGIDNTAPGVWHSVRGTGNMMRVSLCNPGTPTDFDSRLSVYCSGCSQPTCVDANDDSACGVRSELTFCSTPDRLFEVLVHGTGAATGPYELTVQDTGEYCGPLYLSCRQANETCSTATKITGSGISGDNIDAVTDSSVSCASSSADVWYSWDAQCHGFFSADTCQGGSLGDTVLSLHDGCAGRELDCSDDDSSCSPYSRVHTPHRAGDTIGIRVAEYGSTPSNSGDFRLQVDDSIAVLAAPLPGLFVARGIGSLLNQLQHIDPEDLQRRTIGALGVAGISGLAFAPDLGVLYAAQDSIDEEGLFTIDVETGAATAFATYGPMAIKALAWDPARMVLYASEEFNGELLEVDAQTGALTTIGAIGFSGVHALALDPASGTLYGADITTGQLLEIDKTTGVGTAIGSFGTYSQVEGMAWEERLGRLFGVHREATGDGYLLEIDTSTGVAARRGDLYNELQPSGLAFVRGLAPAAQGQFYDETLPTHGGCPGYTFANVTGLPAGLTADGAGRVTGIPTVSGRYSVTFTVGDSDLATPAQSAETILYVRPAENACTAAPLVQDGSTPFTTLYATTDGPDEPVSCNFFSETQVSRDTWFCYQASCTGTLTADTCDADYDSRLAVYEGCGCPAWPDAAACDDDSCGTASSLTHSVQAGQRYLVRVGGYREAWGEGTLTLSCEGSPGGGCCLPGSCELVTEEECLERGGTFQGAESDCSVDRDGDGILDSCDGCPDDPNKAGSGACGCGSPDVDTDGDGLADCVDDDLDGDGVANADDCASGDPDIYPGAPEINDGKDNHCPADPGHGLVDEITGLAGFYGAPTDKQTFSWSAQVGATAYDVARADDPQMSLGCSTGTTTTTSWIDAGVPGPAGAFFYLVRASAPNTGSWGADSSGISRSVPCF